MGVYSFASIIFLLWLNQDDWMRVFIYSSLHVSVLVFTLMISWFHSFNQRRLFLYGFLDEIKNVELQEANRLLWSQAHTDPLTDLPNRSLLMDRLNQIRLWPGLAEKGAK